MPDLKKSFLWIFFLIWLFLSGCTTEPVETNLLLPVEFSNIPQGMALTPDRTDKIEIRIQADPRRIEMITQKALGYPADLYTDLEFDPAGDSDSIEPGAYVLPVDKNRMPLGPGVKILAISPPYLRVRLEKKITKRFKILVPYTGEPAMGHLALEPFCEPDSVELTGAQSLINAIDQLKTKPIDLTGANEDFKKKIPLDLEIPLVYSSSETMFTVTVPIQQKIITKTLADIPIQLLNTGAKKHKVTIEPSAITLEIKGPFDMLANKTILDQIYSFVDLKGMKKGVYTRHAYINLPVDLVMTGATPRIFTIKIE